MKSVKAIVFSGLLISAGMAHADGAVGNLPEIQAKLQARIQTMVTRSVQADLQRQIDGSRQCMPHHGRDRQFAARTVHAGSAS